MNSSMIDFQALIKKHDLTDYQEQLHRIAKTMIRIAAERTSDSSIKVGASKMGGDPDLPMKFEWPTWKEEPLSFLVQLNLTEINIFQASMFAAREGMLYFFIDTELNAYEEGSGRVMYSNSQAQQLQRTRNPASEPIRDKEGVKYRTEADMAGFIPVGESYNPCRLTFTEELSLLDGRSPTVWGSVFGKDQAFIDDYFTWKR